jgi:hypothetical protein
LLPSSLFPSPSPSLFDFDLYTKLTRMAYYSNFYLEELTNQEPELLRTIGTAIGDGEKLKAELMTHPLFEQLLAAHVACMRVATPVDQLATLDAQLAESPRVVAKYSNVASAGAVRSDGKELDHFMAHYVLLLNSFKEQLQQHHFLGWTYGYIQDKDFTVYANKGQIADMKINLLIGVNMSLDILFKKEHLISNTPYNMSARVRFFDDAGNLVATWMSSEGVYVTGTGQARAADNTNATAATNYAINGGLNYVPGGVNLLHVSTAGLPPYGAYGDPVFTPGSGDFEVDNWPADYWSVAKAHFPNEGILGQPDYTGTGWTAEVDFVNWYLNNTKTAQDPVAIGQTTTPSEGYYSNYYPVVPALLMGESYHIIPGTTAKSGISLTEDGALNPYFLGHSMVANHLGPYSQQGVWTLGPAHLSGETSAIWEVDMNGYISGTALAFTWSNELRAISWYTVNIAGAGNVTFNSYTSDGVYEFYVVPGQYSMTISGPGYKSTPLGTISVSSGQSSSPGSGNNIGLPQTNIPVPEFSGIAVVAFSALAASLDLLRRRRA